MAKQSKISMCKYIVQNFVLSVGSEFLKLNNQNILAIEYCNDYEFNIRSILKVSLLLDVRQKIWIMKNKDKILAKFELDKIGMDVETENYNTSTQNVWNEIFSVYFSDDEETSDVNIMEERVSMNEGEEFVGNKIQTENYFESQNTLDIFLFNHSLLNASNTLFNKVITKDTMRQIVGRLLTQTKHKKVLISPIENDEVYEELLVPANPSYKGLIYLDQYYGLYKKGAMIFYDVDYLYILNTRSGITARRPNEKAETVFLVSGLDSAVPGNGIIQRELESINYINVNDGNVNPKKFSIINNEQVGSEAKMVISDDITIDVLEANQSYIDQRNESIIYSRKNDNKYYADIVKARMEENECALYITGDNFDISAFTPNKMFQIVFEDTSKNKEFGNRLYRLVYAYHMIKAESDYMVSSHMITLKKCSSND